MIIKTDDELFGQSNHVPRPLRLCAAIMRRAVVDFVLYRQHKSVKLRRIGRDADIWLFGPSSMSDFSSFVSICSYMNLPPSLLRDKIRAMTEEDARRLRGMEFGDDIL